MLMIHVMFSDKKVNQVKDVVKKRKPKKRKPLSEKNSSKQEPAKKRRKTKTDTIELIQTKLDMTPPNSPKVTQVLGKGEHYVSL